MAKAITTMRVKNGGKIVPADAPIDLDDDDRARLIAAGAVTDKVATLVDRDDEPFDLADRLATLIAEGHEIASMTVKDIQALLGPDGKGVKRADIDAALDTIKAEDVAGQQATARITAIVDAIVKLGPEALDDDGAVDPAAVRGVFPDDDPPSDDAIAAAVAIMALTGKGDD